MSGLTNAVTYTILAVLSFIFGSFVGPNLNKIDSLSREMVSVNEAIQH